MSKPADAGGAANVWSPSRLPELRFEIAYPYSKRPNTDRGFSPRRDCSTDAHSPRGPVSAMISELRRYLARPRRHQGRKPCRQPRPQDMASFIPAILDHFAETAPEAPAAAGQVSDPQLDSPVGWAVAALRWAPRPSIPGALAGLMAGALVTKITAAQSLLLSRPAAHKDARSSRSQGISRVVIPLVSWGSQAGGR